MCGEVRDASGGRNDSAGVAKVAFSSSVGVCERVRVEGDGNWMCSLPASFLSLPFLVCV